MILKFFLKQKVKVHTRFKKILKLDLCTHMVRKFLLSLYYGAKGALILSTRSLRLILPLGCSSVT